MTAATTPRTPTDAVQGALRYLTAPRPRDEAEVHAAVAAYYEQYGRRPPLQVFWLPDPLTGAVAAQALGGRAPLPTIGWADEDRPEWSHRFQDAADDPVLVGRVAAAAWDADFSLQQAVEAGMKDAVDACSMLEVPPAVAAAAGTTDPVWFPHALVGARYWARRGCFGIEAIGTVAYGLLTGKDPDAASAEAPQLRLARHVSWWWPMERWCVLVERPATIRLDAAGRLDGGDGPALEWRAGEDGHGGLACYALDGHPVPAAAVTGPLTSLAGVPQAAVPRVLGRAGLRTVIASGLARPAGRLSRGGRIWEVRRNGSLAAVIAEVEGPEGGALALVWPVADRPVVEVGTGGRHEQ